MKARSIFSLLPTMAGASLALGFAALTSGCGKRNEFVPPPPPEVEVVNPETGDVTVYVEFPGRTDAFAKAEIRARVKGFLKSRDFEPGKFVKAADWVGRAEAEAEIERSIERFKTSGH